jgi:hypothetical protein
MQITKSIRQLWHNKRGFFVTLANGVTYRITAGTYFRFQRILEEQA